MKPYTPRQGSVPARLIEHLSRENPGSIMLPADIAEVLGVPKNNVSASLYCAVKSGALVRERKGWRLPDDAVAQVATTNHTVHAGETWGGATQPAFPAAPPRAGDPPRKTLKQVAQEFHREKRSPAKSTAGTALAAVWPPTPTPPSSAVAHIQPIDLQPASLRQVGGTHYKQMNVQPWDVVDGWPLDLRIGYYRGNALKYLMRMGSKDEELQEILKCQHYVAKLVEVLRERGAQVAA